MTKPLEGIRVLDLTQFLSGPQATLFLAGPGAEAIRIDNPATGDPVACSPPRLFGEYLRPDDLIEGIGPQAFRIRSERPEYTRGWPFHQLIRTRLRIKISGME